MISYGFPEMCGYGGPISVVVLGCCRPSLRGATHGCMHRLSSAINLTQQDLDEAFALGVLLAVDFSSTARVSAKFGQGGESSDWSIIVAVID